MRNCLPVHPGTCWADPSPAAPVLVSAEQARFDWSSPRGVCLGGGGGEGGGGAATLMWLNVRDFGHGGVHAMNP